MARLQGQNFETENNLSHHKGGALAQRQMLSREVVPQDALHLNISFLQKDDYNICFTLYASISESAKIAYFHFLILYPQYKHF